MSMLIDLAFRNIFRFKRRTCITFSTISIGLALLIIIISLLNGIDQQSMRNLIDCQTSHLKIFKKGYFAQRDELPMNFTISEVAKIKKFLSGVPHVQAVEGRILFAASLIKGMDELPCVGAAIETGLDDQLFITKKKLIKGNWLEKNDNKVLIGRNLAQDIALKVGDTVTVRVMVSAASEEFTWNALDMEIKGIYDSGEPAMDGSWIIMPMDIGAESLSMDHNVTELVVRLDSERESVLRTTQTLLQHYFNTENTDLEVYSWKDLASTFLVISDIKAKRSGFIILIMLFLASLGIINTMWMAVLERTREIGMMAALGMKKVEIMALFVFEGGMIGALGSLLGCILGGLGTWYLHVHGWSMASMGSTVTKLTQAFYPVKDVFYAEFSVLILPIVFAFGTLLAMLAAFFPARKAAKLDPVAALRHI